MDKKKVRKQYSSCGFIDKKWMHNVHYYFLSADNGYFSMFNLSNVSKLYFHTQFKNHNIQILNNKCLISKFYRRTADIY
jgi:hypothetical protein